MRRVVRDYIAAAVDRARPRLEQFIAEHLQCPTTVPLVFTEPVASIREIRSLKVTPRFPADYPVVDVVVVLSVSLTAKARQRGVGVGTRTLAVDVTLAAVGVVTGAGYDLAPQRARLTRWWRAEYARHRPSRRLCSAPARAWKAECFVRLPAHRRGHGTFVYAGFSARAWTRPPWGTARLEPIGWSAPTAAPAGCRGGIAAAGRLSVSAIGSRPGAQ